LYLRRPCPKGSPAHTLSPFHFIFFAGGIQIRMEEKRVCAGTRRRYSGGARAAVSIATRSGRTFWVKATTHAERAKSGVLLEVGSDFLIQ